MFWDLYPLISFFSGMIFISIYRDELTIAAEMKEIGFVELSVGVMFWFILAWPLVIMWFVRK